jgi:glycosyltransferase involved in cell wall biosynthesis
MGKRILIFSTAFDPFIGGAEVAVKEITARLGSDFTFEMITARLDSTLPVEEKIGPVVVHRVGKGTSFDKIRLILSGPALAHTLGKFDAVWAIMASYAGFAALRYKKKNSFTPFLLTLQEGDSKWHIYKHVWWCWWYFKQIFKKADRIQVISKELSAWARSLGAKNPISIIPNGVALENFHVADQLVRDDLHAKLRTELGIPEATKLIVTTSRLVKKNGGEYLIRSLVYLPYSVQLVVVGDGELKAKLRSLAKINHVENRVHFVGSKKHSELKRYVGGSDVFCRPSLSVGLGNSFLEPMAAEVPVVATPVGGIPDFLEEGVTGWFSKPRHPKMIADKIAYILEPKNAEDVQRVVRNAYKMILEKYTWEIVAERMKKVFETV